jgi:DNA-binding NarL/FixJ family response regulator
MPKVVGVFNAPPVYVIGLTGLLSSNGYALETVTDPLPWLRRHRGAVVLLGVRDSNFGLVVDLKVEEPESVVVALVDEVNVSAFHASLSAGAAGLIARDAGASEVVLAFNAAMTNNVVIPTQVARELAAENGKSHKPSSVNDEEFSWLRALASGETVAELSNRIGYSEREMYRQLRRLYSRLGASGRTEALLKVVRLGWLD